MKLARLASALVYAMLLGGCATSTAPGAVGVTRGQLLMVPASTVNAQAVLAYSKLSAAAHSAGKLNNDSATVTRVRGIAGRLIREVGVYRPDAANWAWEVSVFDSPQINAFCAAGGKIGVFTGIITRLDLTDDELAAVLGHEISHALREHSREKASQAVLSDAVVRAVANSGSRNAGLNRDLAQIGSLLFMNLPFSREMELEADSMGLELMARAGFDPAAAPNVWRKMQARLGESGAEFFQTHPNHERRISELEAATPKVASLYAVASKANGKTNFASNPTPISTSVAVSSTAGPAPSASALQPLNPALNALIPPAAAPKTAAATQIGQDSYQVDRMARNEGCNANPRSALTGKGPGFETYSVTCSSGDIWSVRCEYGQCRVLK